MFSTNHDYSRFHGIQVAPRRDEPMDKAIGRFMKKVRAEKVLDEWRLRSRYEKPSVRRRRKRAMAAYRRSREER